MIRRAGLANAGITVRIMALAASCVWACGSGGDFTDLDRDAGRAPRDGAVPMAAPASSLPFIHDASRRSTPASAQDRLRIVSWNIKAARAAPLEAIGRRLQAMEADVIALQEVDLNVDRTGRVDQPALLADMLQAEYAFAAAVPYDGGYHGLAVLSRHPFANVERVALSNEHADEARTAIDVAVCAGAVCLRLVDHHADLVPAARERSVLEILEAVRADIGRGVIVAGDFNQTPAERGPRSYVEAGLEDLLAAGESTAEASDRVDFIFADRALAGCLSRAEVVQLDESDHAALLADFDLSRCEPSEAP